VLTRCWLMGFFLGAIFWPAAYQFGKVEGLRSARRIHRQIMRGDFR